jgi:hypothetical protein
MPYYKRRMPRLCPRLHRPSAGFLLLLHLALLAAWAPHATATRDGAPVAHIEEAGRGDCQVPHGDAGCGLCQLTATRVVVGDPAVPQPQEARVTLARRADVVVSSGHSIVACGHPRAPPRETA